MSKVVLVMNDPMFCGNCPLANSHKHIITAEEHWFCGIGYNTKKDYVFKKIDMDSEIKPNWCPLKPLPEKDKGDYVLQYSQGYQEGWNDCIKAIYKE